MPSLELLAMTIVIHDSPGAQRISSAVRPLVAHGMRDGMRDTGAHWQRRYGCVSFRSMLPSQALAPAPIVSFEDIERLRPTLGKMVVVSGGFDPVHPGHASNVLEASKLGDTLIVVVNGDTFLRNKKGRAFQDVKTRCQIVSFLRGVDYVVPFEIENDQTVCEALRRLRPAVFAKGGDRSAPELVPEWGICQEAGIEMVFGIGASKEWSSSDFLKDWGNFWVERKTSPTLL